MSEPHVCSVTGNYCADRACRLRCQVGERDARRAAKAAPITQHALIEVAINQNDAMRQELAHVGNLVSDLERAMCFDPADPDGSWPDLAGRVRRLTEHARAVLRARAPPP